MFKVGDKGDEYVLNEEESDKENELLKELDQIATVCISAMKRWNSWDQIELEIEDEEIIEEFSKPLSKKSLMVPRSVKGIKTISFLSS